MFKVEIISVDKKLRDSFPKLLKRQLSQSERDNEGMDFEKLCTLVAQAYDDYEQEISISNLACDLASKELGEANKTIRQQCDQYELALSGSNDGLWDWNLQTQEVFYSERWKEMLGYSVDTKMDSINDWLDRIHPDHVQNVKIELEIHLSGKNSRFEYEYKIQDKNGKYIWMLARGKASSDSNGIIVRIAGCQTNINIQKEYQSQLAHAILHDPLTKLPNRTLLNSRLEHFIAKFSRSDTKTIKGGILYIDIDRFKVLNDNLGKSQGDLILNEFSERVQKLLRPEDTFARFEGDEFVILLEDITKIEYAENIAKRVARKLEIPFMIEGEKIYISVSIGIYVITSHNVSADVIIINADIAMSQAKSLGRRRYVIFDKEINFSENNQYKLEKDLHAALEKNELLVVYQPIINLSDYSVSGFEALIRWRHSTLGVISPLQFIPLAEQSGLIRPIGEFVLKTACEQLLKWKKNLSYRGKNKIDIAERLNNLSMSVNISMNQLSDPDTVDRMLDLIKGYALSNFSLHLELTESILSQNIDMCRTHLDKFKERNLKLSIDDFGTGFSSLSYLDSFPFDILKIDRQFVTRMEQDEKTACMISGIIDLSHNLDYKIIAEGIETLQQVTLLRNLNCEFGQGYYFSPPVSAEEAEKFIIKGFAHIQKAINGLEAPDSSSLTMLPHHKIN